MSTIGHIFILQTLCPTLSVPPLAKAEASAITAEWFHLSLPSPLPETPPGYPTLAFVSFTLSEATLKQPSQQEDGRLLDLGSSPSQVLFQSVPYTPSSSRMQDPSATYYAGGMNAIPGPSYQAQPAPSGQFVPSISSNGSQNGGSTRSTTRPAKKKAAKGVQEIR